jgi:hypothetical protein
MRLIDSIIHTVLQSYVEKSRKRKVRGDKDKMAKEKQLARNGGDASWSDDGNVITVGDPRYPGGGEAGYDRRFTNPKSALQYFFLLIRDEDEGRLLWLSPEEYKFVQSLVMQEIASIRSAWRTTTAGMTADQRTFYRGLVKKFSQNYEY